MRLPERLWNGLSGGGKTAADREHLEELRSTIERAPNAVAMFDSEMRYLAASHRFVEDFGLTAYVGGPAGVVGLSHYDLFPEIPERWKEIHRLCLAGATERCDRDSFRRVDGRTEWLRWDIRPWYWADGQVGGIVLFTEIITDRVESEGQLRLFTDSVKDHALIMLDPNGKIVSWNSGAERLEQYREDEILGTHFSIFFRAEDIESGKPERELRIAVEEGRYQEEGWRLRKDGTEFLAEISVTPLFDAVGKLCGFGKVTHDITEKKRAEEAERASAARYRAVIDTAADAIVVMDEFGIIHAFNHRAETLFGYPAAEAIGRDIRILVPDPASGAHESDLHSPLPHCLDADKAEFLGLSREVIGRRRDGAVIPLDLAVAEWHDGDKRYFTGIMRDITERKRHEETLNEQAAKLKTILDTVPAAIFITSDPTCRTMVANRYGCELLRIAPAANPSKSALEPPRPFRVVRDGREIPAEDLPVQRAAAFQETISGYECEVLYRDGMSRYLLGSATPLYDAAGQAQGAVGVFLDITERRRVEDALRGSERRLRLALDASATGTFEWDFATGRMVWDKRQYELFGLDPGRDSLLGKDMLACIHPDDLPAVRQSIASIADAQGRFLNQFRVVHPAGDVRWLAGFGQDMTDASGNVTGVLGLNYDVTEQVEAERRFQETQAALHQAQKMEAVGQLAGGIAHDFNNLLQVIGGNIDLLQTDFSGDSPERRQALLDAARRAVDRAERITRHLLSFTRKHVLNPVALNLPDYLRDLGEVLPRLLRPDILVEMVVPETVWPFMADVNHLETAIINIAANSRDAMPEGGRLRFDAKNLTLEKGFQDLAIKSGDFVALEITDTGCGIAPEHMAKLFEPFFTTKEVGQGTGLGLAMVYGFARQSGGDVTVESEVGVGTKVTLYLPRAAAAPDEARPEEVTTMTGSGTILVVDDDAEVRSVIETMLSLMGFSVVFAQDAEHALDLIMSDAAFDLMLTDVIMPGRMNGRELARAARESRPGLPVILTTGFSALLGELAENEVCILSKPFRYGILAKAVQQALGHNLTGRIGR
jgi:PAS domain S-box-containing protein